MKRLLVLAVLAACAPRVPLPSVQASGDVEASLAAAQAAFAKRPDVDSVRTALRAFQSAAAGDASRVEGSIGVVQAAAWLADRGPKEDRKAFVEQAVAAAEQCQQRAPATAPCDYWQAAALGLAAREKPLSALGNLKELVELLRRAEAKAPELDRAGPSRLLAIVLARAPGWPAGPGDPDAALAAAQQAVAKAGDYAPNHSALGEALAATGDSDGARAAYQQAITLARNSTDPDAATWIAEAEAAIQKL